MEEELKNYLEINNLIYIQIDGEESLRKIYNLWVKNTFEEPELIIEFFYYGSYYKNIEKNPDLMKKYYFKVDHFNEKLSDIEKLNISFIWCNLGIYYEEEKDYELMKKYYLIPIELNNDITMTRLGLYYKNIEKDYVSMKKYYSMAIELNNATAMYNLGFYYQYTEKNYDLMKKYYLMATKSGYSGSLKPLYDYYRETGDLSFIQTAVEYDLIEEFIPLLEKHTALISSGSI